MPLSREEGQVPRKFHEAAEKRTPAGSTVLTYHAPRFSAETTLEQLRAEMGHCSFKSL